MKQFFQIALILLVFSACNDETIDNSTVEAYGTVFVSGGLLNCAHKIVLDNGETVIPLNWSDFNLVADDRVWVEYEVTQKQTSCDGQDCKLLNYQVVECTPYVDLYFHNFDSLKNDPVKINEVSLDGNCLLVNLSYSGGCEEHMIDLARIHPTCGTPPLPPPTFEIKHDSKNDLCEAWLTKTLSFDMSPLKDEFEDTVKIVFQANESGDDFYNEELTIKLD